MLALSFTGELRKNSLSYQGIALALLGRERPNKNRAWHQLTAGCLAQQDSETLLYGRTISMLFRRGVDMWV